MNATGGQSLDVTPRPAAASRPARIWAHAKLELSMLLRNGEQLLLTAVLPLGLLVLLSQTTVIDVSASTQQERVDIVVPGIFALAILSTAFTALAIQTGFERRYGVLRRIGTTPLSRADVLGGKAVAVGAVEAIQLMVLGVVGFALGWQPEPAGLVLALPIVVLGSATLAALGLLLAGVVRAEATLALANLAYLVLAGAGVLVPVAELPERLQPAVDLLPSAALAEALRLATIASEVNVAHILVLVAWLVGSAVGVARLFRWE
ncbi:MAG TPA: ABC transporter permease [Actinomycetes bacterium]|nr:ABC transporter permease [Actinomycetes bacterium]